MRPALSAGPLKVAAATVAPAALVVGLCELLPVRVVLLLALGAGSLCALVIASALSATLLFAVAVALQCFSSNWAYLGLPIGLDRLLLPLALAVLVRQRLQAHSPPWRSQRPGVLTALVLLSAWAACSAALAGTLLSTDGAFALLDRLGLVPFAAFALAPMLFGTPRQRSVLLVVLVALGAYLGSTALFQALGADALVFPRYILDTSIGIHQERARGPFLEGVANGLALYSCAAAAWVASRVWERRSARTLAACVAFLCVFGTLFTLTRAVWLASVFATLVAMVSDRRLRPRVVPALLVAGGLVAAVLVLVPGFSSAAGERSTQQGPVWDRYNTNLAAVRILADHALTGIGWQRFPSVGPDYIRLAEDYPVTGAGLEVHNVFLSHAAELGLIGVTLYGLALVLAVGGGVRRPTDEDTRPFRTALIAIAAAWTVVACFGPLSYALPNTLLWLWAGMVRALPRPTAPPPPTTRDRALESHHA